MTFTNWTRQWKWLNIICHINSQVPQQRSHLKSSDDPSDHPLGRQCNGHFVWRIPAFSSLHRFSIAWISTIIRPLFKFKYISAKWGTTMLLCYGPGIVTSIKFIWIYKLTSLGAMLIWNWKIYLKSPPRGFYSSVFGYRFCIRASITFNSGE